MLIEMNCRRTRAEVRPIILSSNRIYRILSKISFLGCRFYRLASCFRKYELIETDWAIDIKKNAPGILADGLGLRLCQGDILLDDLHRALGDGALLFPLES